MHDQSLVLPDYASVMDLLAGLGLPFSVSELHGVMCGYLVAGKPEQGEAYLLAWVPNKTHDVTRAMKAILFQIYAISQQQFNENDFQFQLLLPDDEASLVVRAEAFGQWCVGFTQGLHLAAFNPSVFDDPELMDALRHVADFAQLDYDELSVETEDECAFEEIMEYTRMIACHVYEEMRLYQNNQSNLH